ncbi:V-type ATPase subunit [Methanolinea mesophila]|uniref:V-type ATPase subunit n=1 Tax=Methanolinea mesophila TaxID=547055 RepID=UPI002472F488|nr:V-type ATPase subunit [Methanolinea mesophila]
MDYGYANARIRGMHSRLLDRKGYEALLVQPDIPAMVTELGKTPYKAEIEEGTVLYPGIRGIEYALRKNLATTFRKVQGLLAGSDAEIFVRIFVSRYDIHNLKTIIRGIHIHISPEEITECLIPAGTISSALLNELLKQGDVRGVVDLLATWDVIYTRPLTAHMKEYAETGSLSSLEYALDLFHYENSKKTLTGKTADHKLMQSILAAEIDSVNIKTALKMNREGISPEESAQYFLPGGTHLPLKLYRKLVAAPSIGEAVSVLQGTSYEFLVSLPLQSLANAEISLIEKEMDRYLVRKGASLYHSEPLGGVLCIGYLFEKQNEVTNIRIIGRFKTAMISDADVEETLLYV